jgi:hypothetical protein
MTGLVRKALTIAAGLAVVASVASAGVPSPQQSSVEPVIVGNASGNPLGAPGSIGTQAVPGFEVVVRDVNNSPLQNKNVVVDYSATSIKLHNSQSDGSTLNCAAKTVAKLTPANGTVVFATKFGSFSNTNAVEVSADGVVLALVKARSTDIDGVGATTALSDFALFSSAFAAVLPAQQVNFNLSPSDTPDLGDFAIFSAEFASAAVGTYCP